VVLTDDDQLRGVIAKCIAEALFRRLECAIEQSRLPTSPLQACGRKQCLQRRIGLHLSNLLAIEEEVIRVGEEYTCHVSWPYCRALVVGKGLRAAIIRVRMRLSCHQKTASNMAQSSVYKLFTSP